ncbi:MAG: GNAT family N-acetyltransferase [Euzebyaceae bacterium]|nr:GNAT family N-acetyltransferase [Euzebyaceae bacterium]
MSEETSPPPRLPDGYPAEFDEVAALDDGASVTVRAITPDDAPRLHRLYYRLSPQSLYRRFFTPVTRPDRDVIASLVHVDYADRLALVALSGDEVVGIARYERLPPGGNAEVAVIVEDAWQGRGVGTLLLERLAAAASARGIRSFVAAVQSGNRPMMGLLRAVGEPLETSLDGTEYRVRVALGPPTGGASAGE